ncbi:hypothetical protein [Thiohalophilus sp.]|uniref:hypothetical protein n=1 Tax=Thiohalophilus sp. TaxID=3028392 RepID=UPI002ACD2493|nr:hypothetical protein [Thiohalophilus sp.]MDZ7804307.1 hypothetical protein [Thiohalophilus sp.]
MSLDVLGERGAAILRELGYENVSSRGHRDLTFDKPTHRFIANAYVIDYHLLGHRTCTQFERQRRIAPLPEINVRQNKNDEIARRKIPDALVEAQGGISWVEVENTPKARSNFINFYLLPSDFLRSEDGYMTQHDGQYYWFDRMTFVLPNDKTARSLIKIIASLDLPFDILCQIHLHRVSMSSGLIGEV